MGVVRTSKKTPGGGIGGGTGDKKVQRFRRRVGKMGKKVKMEKLKLKN